MKLKTDYLNSVKEFHKMSDLPVGLRPKQIDPHTFSNRMRLITEELSEYCEAVSKQNIVEVADALGDLLYVVFGACVEHGLPMDQVFKEIHISNMSKRNGHRDKGGKWIKPSDYKPVDLSWLRAIGWDK